MRTLNCARARNLGHKEDARVRTSERTSQPGVRFSVVGELLWMGVEHRADSGLEVFLVARPRLVGQWMTLVAVESPEPDCVLGCVGFDLPIADLSDLPVIRIETDLREFPEMIKLAAPTLCFERVANPAEVIRCVPRVPFGRRMQLDLQPEGALEQHEVRTRCCTCRFKQCTNPRGVWMLRAEHRKRLVLRRREPGHHESEFAGLTGLTHRLPRLFWYRRHRHDAQTERARIGLWLTRSRNRRFFAMSIAHTGLHATRDNLTRVVQLQFAGNNLRQAEDCLQAALHALRGTRNYQVASAALAELRRASDVTVSLSLRIGFVGATDAYVADALASLHEDEPCSPEFSRPIPPPIARFDAVAANIRDVVMKHQRPERFVFVPMLIISFPDPPSGTTVYGVFSVDAWAIQQGHPKFVKQDFVAYQPWDGDTKYFGGMGGGANSFAPEAICERFGAPHYGCVRQGTGWLCADHSYGDEADRHARLPKEPEFRRLMDEAIEKARRLAPTALR